MASGLHAWLPDTNQFLETFISPEITLGRRWVDALEKQLSTAQFGIVCVTPESVDSPYLNWEVGQLSYDKSRQVVPILLGGLTSSQLNNAPLGHFQSVLTTGKNDIIRLVRDLNIAAGNPVSEDRLLRQFELTWRSFGDIIAKFDALPGGDQAIIVEQPTDRSGEMLARITEIERSLDKLTRNNKIDNQIRRSRPNNGMETDALTVFSKFLKSLPGDSVFNADDLVSATGLSRALVTQLLQNDLSLESAIDADGRQCYKKPTVYAFDKLL